MARTPNSMNMAAEVVRALSCEAASLWANSTQGCLWNQPEVYSRTCPVESHQGSLPVITNTLYPASLSKRLAYVPSSLSPARDAGNTGGSQKSAWIATSYIAPQIPTFQSTAARPQKEEPELQASNKHLAADAQLSHTSQVHGHKKQQDSLCC